MRLRRGQRAFNQHLPSVRIMSSMVGKPQLPMRVMYARLVGSEAPVALLYSTRARGTRLCSAFTAMPVSDGSARDSRRCSGVGLPCLTQSVPC